MPFTPICSILAGPNGAGKSTLWEALAPPGEIVNADTIARRVDPDNPARAAAIAGRLALERLGKLISDRQNFSYETTLSSNQSVNLMRTAKAAGFQIELAYVLLRSPELHLARIQSRVAQGGHDIPPRTVLRRYQRSLARLADALRLADQVIIYDNTEPELVTLVRYQNGIVTHSALDVNIDLHQKIANALLDGTGCTKEAVFHKT